MRFFDLNDSLNLSIFHFSSPKYLMQPTIDLTCCCKKDLEENFKVILSLFFFMDIFFIVLIGDFAPQEEARNVEKSWVPINNFAPLFIALISNFLRICQALFFCNAKGDILLIITYSYVLFFASNLEWNLLFAFFIFKTVTGLFPIYWLTPSIKFFFFIFFLNQNEQFD